MKSALDKMTGATMNTCSMNDTAKNGFTVHTSVELLWKDNEPFAKLPFLTQTIVNGSYVFMSHHKTNAEAKKKAAQMHACYLKVHGRGQQ